MDLQTRLGKGYFVTGLALLVAAIVLTLAAAAFGEGRTIVELPDRMQMVIPGLVQIALFTLPFTLAASTFVCGLGCVQGQVRVAQTFHRSAVWAAGVGVALIGWVPWWAAQRSSIDETRLTEAYWIGFAGTVVLFYALLVNFIGSVRYFVGLRRAAAGNTSQGGANMTAMKIYARGGLLIAMLVVLRVGLGLSPWSKWSVGFSTIAAGLFVYPIAVALGAASLVLSVLQPALQLAERVKTAAAILYFLGAMGTLLFLYEDVRRDPQWETMHWPTAIALLMLLVALAINFAGVVRSGSAATAEPAVRAD